MSHRSTFRVIFGQLTDLLALIIAMRGQRQMEMAIDELD
jgi:hypothetical protein